jgi:hypothetical protein
MNQVRAKKKKRHLILPKYLESVPDIPKTNANVLLHGYPGGIRHEPVDIEQVLTRYGYHVENSKFGFVVTKLDECGELNIYFGETLQEVLFELKDEDEDCKTLYHHVCRDPLEQTRSFVVDSGFELETEQYLFDVVNDRHREDQLTVSRIYRKFLGKAVDLVSKWDQSDKYGDGYVAFKFPVEAYEQDVYHVGAGGWFGQTFRGIQTTGHIRCVDPQRDGSLIEMDPSEEICVSDCSYGDSYGMSNVDYFYKFYSNWINNGKKVYFKGDLCFPPKFPCKILGSHLSRKHNREFIGYADNTMVSQPDYEAARRAMSDANVVRNEKARDGRVTWPSFDKNRVEQLLCKKVGYRLTIPEKVTLERRICGRMRFPISRESFSWRCKTKMSATPFNGITNSVIIWLFEQLEAVEDGVADIDMLCYPYFENHQFVEECLWSFEECASRLGIVRVNSRLRGTISNVPRENFTRLVEKSAARH